MAGRYFNRQGGVSRCLAELADRASIGGDDVTVYANEVLDRRDSGVRFEHVPMLKQPGWLQTQTFSLGLRRRLRGERFDLLHVQGPQGVGADVYTAHTCHRGYIEMRRDEGGAGALLSRVYPPHLAALDLERRCFTNPSSTLIVLTELVKSELEHHLGVDPARIRIVPNGVDTSSFVPAESREAARAAVSPVAGELAGDAIVLLFAGYEFHRKGLARIIDAMARTGDARLVLLVSGGDDPGPYRRQAASAGLEERVRFLGHRSEMLPLFQAADAFLLPSSYEGFALVLLEALACGTPVIASRVAGAAKYLEDGRDSLLLENAEDVDELTQALRRFVEARERWPELRAAARSVAETLDWSEVWARTRAVYEEVLERRPARLRVG